MRYIIVFFLFLQVFTVEASAQQYKYHIVEKGETIYSISLKYNTSEEVLFEYNPDARNGIAPQDKLVVPISKGSISESEVEFATHRVSRRETLYSLSRQYNVTVEDIRRYNKHLYAEELQRGEKIRIPVNLDEIAASRQVMKAEQDPTGKPLDISVKEHVVLPKETRFGIARKYNITVGELQKLNPHLEVLQPGMVLKVSPGTAAGEDAKTFEYYLVKPDETLYSLTRKFGINKDSLVVLNPALAEGLKSGMVLKIPNQDPLIPKIDYSEENNINLENKLSNFETKEIVVMLPFNTHKIIQTDSTTNAKAQLKDDMVMQIALDFYSGVKMAVDSARSVGISTDLRVFDTQGSSGEVNRIISGNDFEDVDAVIGPLIQAEAETAAVALQRKNIPVISPLTKKETLFIPNFFQTRPSEKMLEEAMLSYMKKYGTGKNIIIIADAASADKKRTLFQIFPDARIVNPRQGSYVNQSELIAALDKEGENWVVLETEKIDIISNATSFLNSLADSFNITLLTTLKNNSFESENVSNHHLSNLHFHFPSVDREFSERNSFIMKYREKYGFVPNTYAIRGFDVTYDILLRLASAPSLEESVMAKGTTEYVENKFDYQRQSAGGYYNKAIYIMAYGDNLELRPVHNDIESNLFRRLKD